MADPAADLCAFVEASPTPYHAVAEMVRRLEEAGFRALGERDRWSLAPGDQRFVVRDGGSLCAFRVGTAAPSDAGFRMVGAHTDSPTLKVRPLPDVRRAGYRLVGVEPYGGPLLYTWLDRDLTLAGRVAVAGGDGSVTLRLVHLPGAPLRIPSLAIHLQRDVNQGLQLDPQRHLVPVWGPDLPAQPRPAAGAAGAGHDAVGASGLVAVLAEALGVAAADVLGHDLVTADTQPPALGGGGEYVVAPRLDNLASCHAGLSALLGAGEDAPVPATQVLVANDHEEVGSRSAEGAGGPFLGDVLAGIADATGDAGDAQASRRALARSRLVSSDMAHAVHPNHAERHEPEHRPRLGGGPVLKVNANQSYATDAGSGAWFAARCREAGTPLQHFVTRADLPCGSTIGPITATRLGVATADVGAPMLAMHSCREMAGAEDVAMVTAALRACFASPATD
jgi:aspartyl aminopeptidase